MSQTTINLGPAVLTIQPAVSKAKVELSYADGKLGVRVYGAGQNIAAQLKAGEETVGDLRESGPDLTLDDIQVGL